MKECVIDLKDIKENVIYTIVECADENIANRHGYLKGSRVVKTMCNSIIKSCGFYVVTVIDGGSSVPINEVIRGCVTVTVKVIAKTHYELNEADALAKHDARLRELYKASNKEGFVKIKDLDFSKMSNTVIYSSSTCQEKNKEDSVLAAIEKAKMRPLVLESKDENVSNTVKIDADSIRNLALALNGQKLDPKDVLDLFFGKSYLDENKVICYYKDEDDKPQPKEEKHIDYEDLENGKMAVITSFSEALLEYNDFLSDFLNGSFDLVIHKTMMKGVSGDNIPLCVVVNTDKIIYCPEGLMTVLPLN